MSRAYFLAMARGEAKFDYAKLEDIEVARHINLALLMCRGVSEEDAGFDTVTTINDKGLDVIARIIGAVREAALRAPNPPGGE